jgi:hypothetical protein
MRELPDLLEDVEHDRVIAAIRERLAQLESEKAELEGSLNKLLAAQEAKDNSSPASAAPVTNASSPAAKTALFRSQFRDRADVVPKRWENPRTGKAGYEAMPRPAPMNGRRASVANRR